MTETLSIRIDAETNKKLDALARLSKRSKSFLAAEAITAYVDAEEWQLGEIQAGLADLDEGKTVATTGLPNGWVPGGNALNKSLHDEDHLVEASHQQSGGASRPYCAGQP